MTVIDDTELAAGLKPAMSRLLKILRREIRKDASFSLTELSALGSIYKHAGLTPSELATREKVTNQSMSQILNKFEERGFILKTRSDEDRRKILITMTPKGKTFVKHKIHKKRAWLAEAIAQKTTESEQETLHKAIDILEKLAR